VLFLRREGRKDLGERFDFKLTASLCLNFVTMVIKGGQYQTVTVSTRRGFRLCVQILLFILFAVLFVLNV
jgi:hypothetical protein